MYSVAELDGLLAGGLGSFTLAGVAFVCLVAGFLFGRLGFLGCLLRPVLFKIALVFVLHPKQHDTSEEWNASTSKLKRIKSGAIVLALRDWGAA